MSHYSDIEDFYSVLERAGEPKARGWRPLFPPLGILRTFPVALLYTAEARACRINHGNSCDGATSYNCWLASETAGTCCLA